MIFFFKNKVLLKIKLLEKFLFSLFYFLFYDGWFVGESLVGSFFLVDGTALPDVGDH